jgi:putative transposase
MARLARIVVPDIPHHVTQRGNRRQDVFFSDEDYAAYRDLVAEACRREGVR